MNNQTVSIKNILFISVQSQSFVLSYKNIVLIKHTVDNPCISIGSGISDIKMFRGNFDVKENIVEKLSLKKAEIEVQNDGFTIYFRRNAEVEAIINIYLDSRDKLYFKVKNKSDKNNRIWLRLAAKNDDHVYGCGEQFSYFDLRGKNFPLFTSEQGVGRNKKTLITWQADCQENAGGDYYWSFFPQPTFVSSQKYYCHAYNTCYMNFDFRNPEYHELQLWDNQALFEFDSSNNYLDLIGKLTNSLRKQQILPEWVHDGIILGIQGGIDVCVKKLNLMRKSGVKVCAVWSQDWSGIRMTSFGKRVMWNWEYNKQLYPDLEDFVKDLQKEGVRFLTYINPYLASDQNLYKEAEEQGFLVKNINKSSYQIDFGEFLGGIIDLTNPQAYEWYKNIIKQNIIKLGIDGWMADFGEYLPTDVCAYNGMNAELLHNLYPVLWAKCNYEAVEECGQLGNVMYFMRAGFSGSGKYSTMMWAGDQNVDWSLDDGLASVIPASLSLAMSGVGLHHSDIGGYTTLFGLKRSKELLLRWCEFSAFTTLMRTHEGNHPELNWQFDSDEATVEFFARMSKIFCALKPYRKKLVEINSSEGIPVIRPLFMHYENDSTVYNLKYEYMFGRDLLVAPVYLQGRDYWRVYLPNDNWIHLWTGQLYTGGYLDVKSPLGHPPVFFRESSKLKELFFSLKDIR